MLKYLSVCDKCNIVYLETLCPLCAALDEIRCLQEETDALLTQIELNNVPQ